MEMIKINKYTKFFNNYISNYDLSSVALIRKKNHTMRVIDNCKLIAESLNLSDEDIFLVTIIGLFHDIGRFKQYEVYGQFTDYQTIDHANLSVEILKNAEILNDYKYRDVVYTAIKNHNKLNIENGLNDREVLFCKIIRDADKLDIIKLVINSYDSNSKEIIQLGNYDSAYSKSALNNIMEGKSLDISKYPNKCDRSLVKLGLFNDINFNFTKNKIIEEKLVDKIGKVYIKSNPIEQENIKKLCKVINERIGK